MMKKYFLNTSHILLAFFISFGFLLSCSQEDDSDSGTETELSTIIIDGVVYEVDEAAISGNIHCGKFQTHMNFEKDGRKIRFELWLSPDGHLLEVILLENENSEESGLYQYYVPPKYKPASTINIDNFNYSDENDRLSYSFSGQLYNEDDNELSHSIAGNFIMNDFVLSDCNYAPSSVSYDSDNFFARTFYNYASIDPGNYRYRYFLNNGYILDILTTEKLTDMPLGTIQFSEQTANNRVDLLKYIGEPIADRVYGFHEQDWLRYSVDGQLTIDDFQNVNGDMQPVGTITMDAKENGTLIHDIDDMNFSARSF